MYFFTADEHYGHSRAIGYCNRPFSSVEEMDETLIANHNRVVDSGDVVIHAGDFTLNDHEFATLVIRRLNGYHIFLQGSHDKWSSTKNYIWESKIENQYVVVCHYAMRVWPRSHYNSWNLYGHSHGKLESVGKQYDIGVDNNNYCPVSFGKIKKLMNNKPDNPNFIAILNKNNKTENQN